MSGLIGFRTVYLKKQPKKLARFEQFERFFQTIMLKILLQNERFERFSNDLSEKTAQKPRKIWTVLSGLSKKNHSKTAQNLRGFLDKPLKTVQILRGFWAVFLDKPFENRSNRSFWSKILSIIVWKNRSNCSNLASN